MKTHILNLGVALSKSEQQSINGGRLGKRVCCDPSIHCCSITAGVNNSGVGCMYQYENPNPTPPYYTDCM